MVHRIEILRTNPAMSKMIPRTIMAAGPSRFATPLGVIWASQLLRNPRGAGVHDYDMVRLGVALRSTSTRRCCSDRSRLS